MLFVLATLSNEGLFRFPTPLTPSQHPSMLPRKKRVGKREGGGVFFVSLASHFSAVFLTQAAVFSCLRGTLFYSLLLLPSKLFTMMMMLPGVFRERGGKRVGKLLKYETRKESGIFAMAKLANISLLGTTACVCFCVC